VGGHLERYEMTGLFLSARIAMWQQDNQKNTQRYEITDQELS
jgi:hypothetical protein